MRPGTLPKLFAHRGGDCPARAIDEHMEFFCFAPEEEKEDALHGMRIPVFFIPSSPKSPCRSHCSSWPRNPFRALPWQAVRNHRTNVQAGLQHHRHLVPSFVHLPAVDSLMVTILKTTRPSDYEQSVVLHFCLNQDLRSAAAPLNCFLPSRCKERAPSPEKC